MTPTGKHSKAPVKTYLAPGRLSELVARPGGLSRQQAIEAAQENLEALRGQSTDILEGLIADLENVIDAKAQPVAEKMQQITELGDRIANVAGTYHLSLLAEASKRLCDLAIAMAERNVLFEDALAVHMRALKLFSPHNPPMQEAAARMVLQELYKVFKYFNIPVREETSTE
jgi:hypothetical protein